MINGTPIRDQIAYDLPYTVELTAVCDPDRRALLGVPVGVYTAVRRNRLGDYVGRVLSLTGCRCRPSTSASC